MPKSFLHIDTKLKFHESELQLLHYQSERDDYYLFRRLRDGTTNIEPSQTLVGYKQTLIDRSDQGLNFYAEYNRAERESLTALVLQDPIDLPDADFLFGDDFLYDSYRTGLDYRYNISSHLSIGSGAEWFNSQVPEGYLKGNYNSNDQYLGSVQTLKDSTSRNVKDEKREMVGVYTQLEYQYGKQSGVLGLRYDHYNDTQDN